MKKFIFLILLILAFVFFGCADSIEEATQDGVDVVEIDDIDTVDEPDEIKPDDIAVIDEDEITEEPTEIVEDDDKTGGINDWINDKPVKDYVVLEGKAEAGPCNLLSQVGAMSVDSDWLMSNYVPGWLSDSDGTFMIRGTFTGTYRFFDFYGTCYSEGQGRNIDGFRLKMVQSSSATSHNINNATTLRFAVAQKHFTDPDDTYYEDIPGAFIQAKSEIYTFLGFPNATKNFYELSVTGDSTADAYLFKFELAVTKGRNGSEVGHYLGKMANAIIDNDTDFKADFIEDVQELKVKEPWDQLKNELVDRGFTVDPAPLWLTHPKAYYTDLMTRTPTVLESQNMDQTCKKTASFTTENSFANPIEFANAEDIKHFANELGKNQSIWSVGICDNGTDTFSCPKTKLLEIESLLEILLPAPANLSYNGFFGNHSLTSGQYYLVDNPGTTTVFYPCSGSAPQFGKNLATVDNNWDQAIGYNNNQSNIWFNIGVKWVSTN